MAQNEKPEKSGKKGKEEGTTALLRRLADEVTQLREEVEQIRGTAKAAPLSSGFSYATVITPDGEPTLDSVLNTFETPERLSRLLSVADEGRVARLAYALSSAPKVSLVRILLEEGRQTAAYLGEKTGLSTGSLYHHLRELIHAEAVAQAGRNRYTLTPSGRRTALLLFALAVSPEPAAAP
jgi:hypothetical protein